jgi:hypothetical protein
MTSPRSQEAPCSSPYCGRVLLKPVSDAVPNRGSRPAYLLRERYREGGKVRKRTLANLSSLDDAQIAAISAAWRGTQQSCQSGVRRTRLYFQ